LEVLRLKRRVEALNDEHAKMVKEKENMGGLDAEKRRKKAAAKYQEYKDTNTRIEGQKQMLNEQKRNLKRKLKLP
jgi:hypothetical protein